MVFVSADLHTENGSPLLPRLSLKGEEAFAKSKGSLRHNHRPGQGSGFGLRHSRTSGAYQAVEQIGQSPKLYAYKKDPTKAKTQLRALLKRYATEERRDESPPTAEAPIAGTCPVAVRDFGHSGPPPTAAAGPFPVAVRGFGHSGPLTMPVFTLPRTTGPPGWLAPGTRPTMMVRYKQPDVMPRKPPAPYPFDFYESKGFPASDSLFRYFSDDHAQRCSIM